MMNMLPYDCKSYKNHDSFPISAENIDRGGGLVNEYPQSILEQK